MPSEPSPGPLPPGTAYKLQLFLENRLLGEHALGPSGLRIGRKPDSDIVIDDSSAAPEHCRVFVEGGVCRLADLGSPRGTDVNGRPVRAAILRPGDGINFGRYRLTLVSEAPSMALATVASGARRPAVTNLVSASAQEIAGDRFSRLGASAIALARRHPIRALLLAGFCLLLLVARLSRWEPRFFEQIGTDIYFGRQLNAWLGEGGSNLIGRKKKAQEPEGPKPWVGLVEDESGSPKEPDKARAGADLESVKPHLKPLEPVIPVKDYRGGYGAETTAMLIKTDGGAVRTGATECPKGSRPNTPCLKHVRWDDGSERILIKWKLGSFHKDSWKKLPDEILRALRDTAPYPEGYIDPDEELFPKSPPTVLTAEEANGIFHAITGLDPEGDVLATTDPWDQLLKDERYATVAMRCPACPLAARVRSDRGVYYGEKIK
jgi:hypothetical protein